MSPVLGAVQQGWLSLARCWIITRREVRDTLRDWRLVVPILSLTLVFPALMQFTANIAQRWVVRYGASIVGERIIPFLMMVVGFFPISFSLVIALETFVGEKERHSLEPLLATPLTNSELYWGKTLAAMIPPVVASYLGITVYLVGLFVTMRWAPPPQLLLLVVLLTTAEALVMVSGAVVISSQTTSVRAANILASFVIIPMAILVQGESVIMFWANYDVLWWFVVGLVVIDLLLVRMGAHLFNREELLGRDIDQLDLKRLWRTWRAFFTGPSEGTPSAVAAAAPFSIWRIYRWDLPAILKKSALPIAVVLVTQLGAFAVGWQYSYRYVLPVGAIDLQVPENAFQDIPEVGFLPGFDVGSILFHNLRVVLLGAATGLFSCGAASLVLLMIPQAIIGFFASQVSTMGVNPVLFLATFILPHGIVELPAAIIATGMALRLGATVVSRPSGLSLTEGVLLALADLVKVLAFLILPLLGIAAMLEVWLTPWIVIQVW